MESISVFSGPYHIMSNAFIVNNCIICIPFLQGNRGIKHDLQDPKGRVVFKTEG